MLALGSNNIMFHTMVTVSIIIIMSKSPTLLQTSWIFPLIKMYNFCDVFFKSWKCFNAEEPGEMSKLLCF